MGIETAAAVTMGAGKLADMYGQRQQQNTANDRYNKTQAQGRGLMQTGGDPYQQALFQLLGKQGAPNAVGANSGAIDIGSITGGMNPGNDALSQFLRSDPSKQTGFDASNAFAQLQALDSRNQTSAVNALNSNFGSLGSRFGSGAAQQTSDLLANMGAQTGARNAGILQSSFENQQGRRMQGMGMGLQAAQSLQQGGNQMAQLAAQLGMANQGNQQWNQTFNQNNQQQAFANQMSGLQMGSGMQNQNNQLNAQLFSIMNGLAAPQGNGATALGGGLGDIGQMMMFLPMLKNMGAKKP